MTRHRLTLEGHRGGFRPKNSLKSFSQAIDFGLDSIELDIWLTKDLIPIVIHGGFEGFLEEDFPALNLKAMDKFNDFNLSELEKVRFEGEPIPKFAEILELAKGTQMKINIEIKERKPIVLEILYKMLIDYDMVQ